MKKRLFSLAVATILLCHAELCITADAVIEPNKKFIISSETHEQEIFSSQVSYEELPGKSGNYLYLHKSSGYKGFFLETDGTVPSEEDLLSIPNYVDCKEIIWDDYYAVEHPDMNYPEGTVLYDISVSSLDDLVYHARQFFIQNSYAKQIYFVREEAYTSYHWWDGEFLEMDVVSPDITPEELPDILPELELFDVYENWETHYSVRFSEAYQNQLANYETGSFEQFQLGYELAQEIQQKHSDIIERISPSLGWDAIPIMYYNSTFPIWFDSGDANGDNAIDILDVIITNKAVLGKETLLDTQITALDIDGNGKVDASDSLAVMKYIVGLVENL